MPITAPVFDRRTLVAVAIATVTLAGCGSSSNSSSRTAASSPPGAYGAASTTTAPANSTGAGQTLHLSAVAGKLAFNTKTLTAKAGKVTIVMTNPGSFDHGVSISGNGVSKDGPVVGTGATSTITVTLKPGKYTFFCPVPGHRAGGMHGTLTVT